MTNINKIVSFLHLAEKLKQTPRWSRLPRGRAESSAEHSWKLAVMVFLLADELKLEIDVAKALKMALVHDLAEAFTGDYDAWQVSTGQLSKAEKDKFEAQAMHDMASELPPKLGKEIVCLWQEYNAASTQEARFVKALDKVEALTHFNDADYVHNDYHLNGLGFLANYADKAVGHFPQLASLLKEVKKELKATYAKGGYEWKEEYN